MLLLTLLLTLLRVPPMLLLTLLRVPPMLLLTLLRVLLTLLPALPNNLFEEESLRNHRGDFSLSREILRSQHLAVFPSMLHKIQRKCSRFLDRAGEK